MQPLDMSVPGWPSEHAGPTAATIAGTSLAGHRLRDRRARTSLQFDGGLVTTLLTRRTAQP